MFGNVYATETGNKVLFNENMPLALAEMSSVTVFLFLLDNLPDFKNVLNSSLVTLRRAEDINLEISYVDNCKPIIAQSLLKEIINDFETGNLSDRASEEDWTAILHPNDYEDAYNELSLDTLNNIKTVFDDTVERINTDAVVTEHNCNDITARTTSVLNDDKNEIIIHKANRSNTNNTVTRSTKTVDYKFSQKASILVAMFETLLNITAQTCGGTVVSDHWVLTTVTCLGWLTNFYVDSAGKEKSNQSEYTIIVGATNPFKDGFLHHVTDMVFTPEEIDAHRRRTNLSDIKTWNQRTRLSRHDENLSVVLLRIEPAASVEILPLFRSELKEVEEVQVYGWFVVSNKTGSEVMNVASFSAKILPSEECKANLSHPNQDSLLCLTVQSEIDSKINQMYYGGPVVVQHGGTVRLLAVAQFEVAARGTVLYAYSLATHAAWIETVVANK